MKPFHYYEDPMYVAAAAIIARPIITEESALEESALEEGVEDIAMAVADFKKGDKTNFGVVVDVGQHSISFKAKDLPVTKIAFNQRKMGSKDFVLDKLVKLKESVELEETVHEYYPIEEETLKEEIYWDLIKTLYMKDLISVLFGLAGFSIGATLIFVTHAVKNYIDKMKDSKLSSENAAILKSALDKIKKDSKVSEMITQIKEMPYTYRMSASDKAERAKLVKQYGIRLKALLSADEYSLLNDIYNSTIRESVELDEAAKANDPANLRSIIANHTGLLNKATDSKAKEFHRVAIVNAKEKLKSLGEAMGMGTATITAPGHTLHGKHVSIFHKFDDGRLNVQYAKSDKKGDVLNLTLNKGQYELDEAYKVGFPLAKKAIKAATDLNPDEFKEFLGGMADYFYDVAAMDGSEPIMSRSYIVKTAVHFEQAYKGWKIK